MINLSAGENYQIQITDLNGDIIHKEDHNFKSGIHKLDLSQWDSGMYIVEVAYDQGTGHVKVVKK